jgi:4-amino-4-deoxy-L-arabinose transferase-like glycosyltransferase
VSLAYPCSPIERPWFWSKPVLTFWLIAPSLRLFGLQGAHARPGELVDSWRAEWALRTPSLLLAMLGIWAIFVLVRRLASVRAAVLSAIVLATCPSYFLIARQAMTDMPFVVPMTVALVLAALGLLGDDPGELPRRRAGRWSWPHAPAFYVLLGAIAIAGVLPLSIITAQVDAGLQVAGRRVAVPGIALFAPYWVALMLVVWWSSRLRTMRSVYLLGAWLCCGLATLAKGPAGLALPAITMVVYLASTGRWRAIFTELELPRGLLLFGAVAFPWYQGMLVRHGMAFWRELIGDNYVNRAAGRHGDRGTFEYYLQWLGYGTFPWSGFVGLGALRAFQVRSEGDSRARLARFSLVWAVVGYVVITLVRTKFHHYLLPLVPPLAILAGLFLDEVLESPRRAELLLIALPVTVLCGLDLASLPARVLWLFCYDYVNVPNVGRAWPSPTIYGTRFEYGATLGWLIVGAAMVLVLLALRRRAAPRERTWPRWLFGAAAIALGIATAAGPSTTEVTHLERWRWMVPCGLAAPFVWWLLASVGARGLVRSLVAVAAATSLFFVDGILVDVSPHWSQKHVIAAYYARRASADEPLLVWDLFWRGENFYTANEIYAARDERERTVFLGNNAGERLRAYLGVHAGRRVYFLVERIKLDRLKAELPAALRARLQVVDESNNKLLLLSATS